MTLNDQILAAIREDMPNGDLTTDNLAFAPRFGQARLMAKEDVILSGCGPFEQTVLYLEPATKVLWHFREGEMVLKGQAICDLMGDLVQILKAERVALNFIGHLTGIATLTRCFVKEVEHTQTKILDTRKTTPTFRELEKRAVVHGGGHSHRRSLSEAILLKENHISLAGGIPAAVRRLREHTAEPIEVECASLEEVGQAVKLMVARILLDNMSNDLIRRSLELIPDEIEVEASGNMNLQRVRSVAELGVDFISVGALTHSAPTADLSLLFEWQTAQSESVGV